MRRAIRRVPSARLGLLAMSDFKELDPNIRCFALVGQFLQAWSAMELALRDAIGAALNINPIQLQILSANIRFRDKTDVLRTLVDVSPFPEDEKRRAKARIRKLGGHASKRNMIAHEPFAADPESKGVKFLTVKARGDFQTPDIIWSVHKFTEEGRALGSYKQFLECLESRFRQKPLTQQNYIDALRPFLDIGMGSNWPPAHIDVTMRSTTPLVLAHSQSLPDATHPDCDPATQEETSQTPDKPRE